MQQIDMSAQSRKGSRYCEAELEIMGKIAEVIVENFEGFLTEQNIELSLNILHIPYRKAFGDRNIESVLTKMNQLSTK